MKHLVIGFFVVVTLQVIGSFVWISFPEVVCMSVVVA